MILLTIKKINERKIEPVKIIATSPQNWVYLNQSKTGLVNKEER